MDKKSIIRTLFAGIAFSFGVNCAAIPSNGTTTEKVENAVEEEEWPFHWFDTPRSYEGKKWATFKVFQVLSPYGVIALAREESESYYSEASRFYGKVVLLQGKDFYDDQILTVKKPQILGTYRYKNKDEHTLTVPIIGAEK